MAQPEPSTDERRGSNRARSSSAGRDKRGKAAGGARIRDIARAACDEIAELTGRPVEGVTGIESVDEGWLVTVVVVELERVPPTTSVLASYEVEITGSGEVEGFTRVRRYYRNQAGEL